MPQPDPAWVSDLKHRLDGVDRKDGGMAVSIKMRVDGCFCDSCCPNAWKVIHNYMDDDPTWRREFQFEEHETGPEILLYVAIASAATATLCLAKSAIELITTIVKARAEGSKKGDKRKEPIEIIVRRVVRADELREEKVLRIGQDQSLSNMELENSLKLALEHLRDDGNKSQQPTNAATSPPAKKLPAKKPPKKRRR